MICLTGMTVLLFALAVDGRVGESTSTSFCTETKECLMYDLVCAGNDYEVRRYGAVKWVTAEVESHFMDVAIPRAFRKLFKYITGENVAGAKIEMTAPVIIKVNESSSTTWQPSVYVLSFLLPSKFQANPPRPTDPSIYFTDTPDMNVYVSSYGGWMISFLIKSKVQGLKSALDNVQAPYEKTYYYNVGYDSPMKIMNRHNEVWYIATGEPVCDPTSE